MFEFLWKVIERFDVRNPDPAMLSQIIANQQTTNELLGSIMATLDQFTAALSRIDAATSKIATVLNEVRDKVATLEANAGISASDEASVLGQLDNAASALEAMGKSPENPVPVEPAEPTEPVVTPAEPTV